MTLAAGDLTTPNRVAVWAGLSSPPPNIIQQLIGSMTALIYNKLSRSRLYSQQFVRVFDGVGTMQLVLPDWPVLNISQVQLGAAVIPPANLPPAGQYGVVGFSPGYGYRIAPWAGNLPGDPGVLELVNGFFCVGAQNVRVTYQAGYAERNEPQTVPSANPWQVTVAQPQGIWCRDNGVTYADGTALIPVPSNPVRGQYIPPSDLVPGQYTFSSADAGTTLLFTYSFVPADLEEACIQMVMERYSYRTRIGELSKSLGGQETVRYVRGTMGRTYGGVSALPPEVMDLIWPYVSVAAPAIGAPV